MKERAGKEPGDFWLLDWLGELVVRWAENIQLGLVVAASAMGLVVWAVCNWGCLTSDRCKVTGRSLVSVLVLLIALAVRVVSLARRLRAFDTQRRDINRDR